MYLKPASCKALLEVLLLQLQIDPDMKAGLWMICEAFKERNYLYAYDIYMRLAVGLLIVQPAIFTVVLQMLRSIDML